MSAEHPGIGTCRYIGQAASYEVNVPNYLDSCIEHFIGEPIVVPMTREQFTWESLRRHRKYGSRMQHLRRVWSWGRMRMVRITLNGIKRRELHLRRKLYIAYLDGIGATISIARRPTVPAQICLLDTPRKAMAPCESSVSN